VRERQQPCPTPFFVPPANRSSRTPAGPEYVFKTIRPTVVTPQPLMPVALHSTRSLATLPDSGVPYLKMRGALASFSVKCVPANRRLSVVCKGWNRRDSWVAV